MHMPPLASYRLQLHHGFTFDDALANLDYFSGLGISHLYASPITTAQAGSLHGYDMADPTQVSAELGGEEGLRRLVAALRRRHMGLIADIVPNHMGVGGPGNPWWQDVLAHGEASEYATYFDIDWQTTVPGLRGKIMLPALGQEYGGALAAGELKLAVDAAAGQFFISYFDQRFPLNLFGHGAVLRAARSPEAEALLPLVEEAQAPGHGTQRTAALGQLHAQTAALLATAAGQRMHAAINHAFDVGEAAGRTMLHALLEHQHYRLSQWTAANDEVNWRRFFDVSTLAGLRIEQPQVFDSVHALPFRLFAEGLIDGIRIDHIDGLADPGAYCRQLRERLTALLPARPPEAALERPWIVVEKILGTDEVLRDDWQTDGTTGYDFMNEVSAVLHRDKGQLVLHDAWQNWAGEALADYASVALAARRKVLTEHFSSELDTSCHAFLALARRDLDARSITFHAIRRALIELVVHFPVYRVYDGQNAADRRHFATAFDAANDALRRVDRPVLAAIRDWLGFGAATQPEPHAAEDAALLLARRRFLQLTSPVAAKSVEDTAFYRYGVLISRNEVGADPGVFALSVEAFHHLVQQRQHHYPHAMLATATHDHKRGEDVRMRLAVLSEIPQRWIELVERWHRLNHEICIRAGAQAPGRDYEAMLYQTLVGAWPLTLNPADAVGLADFRSRIVARQLKAQREAKLRTDWLVPDLVYEAACQHFIENLLQPGGPFVQELAQFVGKIGAAGASNSLTQTVLKLTVPGMPDFYQGTEFWDGSLVDPDNRRAVDFPERLDALEHMILGSDDAPVLALLDSWRDGRIKQAIIQRLLQLRGTIPALFLDGGYQPLELHGECAGHAIAFLRQRDLDTLLVVVPRWPLALGDGPHLEVAAPRWRNTSLLLPHALPDATWQNVLTGKTLQVEEDKCALADLASPLPWGIWHLDHRNATN
ncbi:Maltooligosyl trehalose synthase [Andreprevotia sp. IGB-42]|uniref:malto-oligosyltrehalose synthase n=1 Tax=Andreprevotia sp. IGB-42 TaxID=2497473 RepID=UPI00157F2E6B|nr:malto-oligosyltrehalose synthase [Andreprevotia sp. IGB-42]KAF0813338.1 Maltooligosyl trehalose synthase [Andreprevotia sp. IGB-42]